MATLDCWPAHPATASIRLPCRNTRHSIPSPTSHRLRCWAMHRRCWRCRRTPDFAPPRSCGPSPAPTPVRCRGALRVPGALVIPPANSCARWLAILRRSSFPIAVDQECLEALAKSEIAYALEVLASSAPALRDNISRGLAVTSRARHPLFPDIPTMQECGLQGFEISTWNIIVAPRGLDPGLARFINAQIKAVLTDPLAQQRLITAGSIPFREAPPKAPPLSLPLK